MTNMLSSARDCGASRKLLLLCIFLVLLTFPQESFGFGFQFNEEDAADDDSASTKPTAPKRRSTEGKFKFRKIARVYVDKENPDDNDDDVSNAAQQSAEVDNSRMNEDEEFQFERARKARQNRLSEPQTKKTTKSRKRKNDEDDDAVDENSSFTFITSIFGKLFGSSKEESVGIQEDSKEQMTADKSNGIIDWLQWLGEKTGRFVAEEPAAQESSNGDGWTTYLHRWPFNSFFPFGKPQKPIRVPRQRTSNGGSSEQGSDSNEAAPMSQEHFESLLHTLPGFVLNPSNVADIDCRRQLQIFQRQLRGNKLWTYQMLDATGKITAGLLRGNINQFGDFDMCTQVKTLVKVTADIPIRIRGKYCLAHIETQTDVPQLKVPLHFLHGRGLWNSHLGNPSHFVPRYAVANWGICIPQACSAVVVQQMVTDNLRAYNSTGLEFHVEVDDDNDCYVATSTKYLKLLQNDTKFFAAVCLLGILFSLVLSALVLDHWSTITHLICTKLRRSSQSEVAETTKETEHENAEETEKSSEIEDQPTPDALVELPNAEEKEKEAETKGI